MLEKFDADIIDIKIHMGTTIKDIGDKLLLKWTGIFKNDMWQASNYFIVIINNITQGKTKWLSRPKLKGKLTTSLKSYKKRK